MTTSKHSRNRNPDRLPVLLHMSRDLVRRLDQAKLVDRRSRNAEILTMLERCLDEMGIFAEEAPPDSSDRIQLDLLEDAT